jgi:small subunit ribosomal protein S18
MKKQCYFSQHNIKYIDYKDTELLKRFINPHGRMISRRRTGISAKYQRQLATAVKRARFMGLLPYVAR